MNEPPIDQAMKIAVQHHQAQRLAEAEKAYRRILATNPDHAEALRLLGAIAVQVGHLDPGIELIRRAVAISPGMASYHLDLGNALRKKGALDEAMASLQEAIRIEPTDAAAHNALGVALGMKGRIDEAVCEFNQAIRLKPDYTEAHNNLGTALCQRGDWDLSIAASRRAISINPDFADAHANLGNALRGNEDLDEAVAAYHESIRLKPDIAEVHSNLGNALKERGDFEQSMVAHRKAISINPDLEAAHYNLAWTLLLLGDFQRGWPEYEWRLRRRSWPVRGLPGPRWNGEPADGQTILLWGEQGFGDVIQFARYIPMVARRGARVVTFCQRDLVGLLQSNPDLGEIVASDSGLPEHDFQCPLLSLANVFETRLETIPAGAPYLRSDPALVRSWEKKVGYSDGKLRVGLAWAGNPRFPDDRTRSLKLDRLAPFGEALNVKFYSLQKGAGAPQANNPPPGLKLVDFGPELKDFSDTAAVMSLMDLIVTTDTSVAHLAGALGRPVWVMLQFVPDFRWLLDRQDSPWYPTMRLFRQKSRGDWKGVIDRVSNALSKLESAGNSP